MFRSIAFGMAAASVAGLSLWGSLRNGVSFTPDSWAYWQGSVSLLSGHGYRYADGHPIMFWPPGFAGYLAAWQALFGISVATLVKAQIAVGAFAAFGWTALPLSVSRSDSHRLASGVVTALLIAATVSQYFRVLWANFALFALIPWLLWATVRLDGAQTSSATMLWTGLASSALLMMLLTHNSAVAFVPPLLAVALARTGSVRWPAAAIVLIAPLTWWSARWLLGQLESHAGIGGRYSPAKLMHQLAGGIADPFGSAVVPGAIILILVLALIPWKQLSRAQLLALATSAAASVGLLCVFSVVWIWDELDQRFTLFFPLTLMGIVGTSFLLHTGWLRIAAAVVVTALVVLAPAHLVSPVLEASSPRMVPANATISPEASASGRFVLVEPPSFPRNHAELMQLFAIQEHGR